MPTPEQQDILDALADAAVELQVLMPDEAVIVRPVRTLDAFGTVGADVPVATVPCRVRALSGAEVAQLEKAAPLARYAVTVPVGADVRVTDAILARGRRFEVQFVPDSTYAAQLRLLCSSPDPGGAA